MKSWGSNMTLTPLLCPFSVQPGFWQAESRRRRNGCSACFCSLTQSGGWKVSQEICHVQQIRLWMARCGIQMGFWENRWCVRSGGLIMLFEFQLPWEISPGLSVALPSRNGRCVTSQRRDAADTLPAWGFVFQGWKYCPSQDPRLLQCQVLCSWTRGELCGLPRWPHCQWLPGQNSEGEQWCSSSCRCCCSCDLRGLVLQKFVSAKLSGKPWLACVQKECWVSWHRLMPLQRCLLCQVFKKEICQDISC